MKTEEQNKARQAGPREYPVPSEETREKPIFQLLLRLMGRTPHPDAVVAWEKQVSRSPDVQQFVDKLMDLPAVAGTKHVPTFSAPGHFYSPVVDPDDVRPYVEKNLKAKKNDLGGIVFDVDGMAEFWRRNSDIISTTSFPDTPSDTHRYHYSCGPFPGGDAIVLRAMIADLRPKRIVEIGSGFSTAVMLDTADEIDLDLKITCVEPHADRLRSILREQDHERVTIIEDVVQGQPAELFSQLEENDILFVDSSHVVKTGSDVHFEIFSILPSLAPGVVVHFHDCGFPFEYSETQIFKKNYSWNEAYFVRALLMYSTRFKVIFSSGVFSPDNRSLILETNEDFLHHPRSSLWLRVMDDGSPVWGDPHFGHRSRPASAIENKASEQVTKPEPANQTSGFSYDTRGAPEGFANAAINVKGATVSVVVRDNGTGPVYFSMGVRKSGSTLLHKITNYLAKANDVNSVDLPDAFFSAGVLAKDWVKDVDIEPLLKPQNMMTGFRAYPHALHGSSLFKSAPKVFMFRNPLDALVSQYFSDAYSHMLPKEDTEGREQFQKKRQQALETDINHWVLEQAGALQSTMLEYRPVLDDPNCLILRYEDMIFNKESRIRDILSHFGWQLTDDEMTKLLETVDIVPTRENKESFIRKAVPGDHKYKLKTETIEKLHSVLKPTLEAFEYSGGM